MLISEKLKNQINKVDYNLYPSYKGKTLNIEITSRCNEKCIYCKYYAQGLHKQNRLIDDEFFHRITKEAFELGITDVGLYITAEPLMNPKVYEYVDYLKNELGFPYVYISTNGIMLTPDNLEKLVKNGIDSIKFSISAANRESFIKHHGIDAFDKVLSNVKYAYEYRKKHHLGYKLFMFSIITRFNEMEKEEINKLYSPYVDEIILSNVISTKAVKGVEEYLSVHNAEDCATSGMARMLPCKPLFNRIVINEKGYLLSCCYDVRTNMTAVADLNKVSLKEGVYGKEMVALRKKHLENKIEHIICNYCIHNVEEEIYPLNDNLGIPNCIIEPIDMSEEIKARFEIKE